MNKKFILTILLAFIISSCSTSQPKTPKPWECKIQDKVCARIMPQCLAPPCDYVFREFGNPCLAEKANATNIRIGSCEEK